MPCQDLANGGQPLVGSDHESVSTDFWTSPGNSDRCPGSVTLATSKTEGIGGRSGKRARANDMHAPEPSSGAPWPAEIFGGMRLMEDQSHTMSLGVAAGAQDLSNVTLR
jgi:hypothetical protein